MTEQDAIKEAQRTFPRPKWDRAYPILPAVTSPVDNASWLVLSVGGEHIALVDGQPDAQLYKRV